jgi:Zn-finger nucleic acid-binding protein
MDCPRCSVEMAEVTGEDNTVQRCGECGGKWVDATDLNRILLHHNLPALTSLGGRVNVDEIAGMCPACNVDLVVVEGGERHSLHYDTCESCGGIWVDDDEDEVPEKMEYREVMSSLVEFYQHFRAR